MSSLEQFEQTEYEKMMLNDVVPNIKTINVTSKDLLSKSKVQINLQNNIIAALQEYPCPDEEINYNLEEKLINQKITGLKFKGKTKIRADVISKFKNIADKLQEIQQYPFFKKQHIEKYIEVCLESPDQRVKKEYLKSISDCVGGLSLYKNSDLTDFVREVKRITSQ